MGKPLHLSSQNHIIIKTNFAPKIGSNVYTKTKKFIGKIIDVFGPINSPFLSIKPNKKIEPTDYLGEELFVFKEFKPKRNVKKKRERKNVAR
ncbi:MAG: H/ACA ribonucleoprotein complex subunit GAR1 [Candidatus Odinarchaeia archaeon]